MVLLNLITSNKEQLDAIISIILSHKFATSVIVGQPEQAFYLSTEGKHEQTAAYKLQFATKSLLFSEIETLLAKEFPNKEFYMYATPIVQTTTRIFERLKNSVKALNILPRKKTDN